MEGSRFRQIKVVRQQLIELQPDNIVITFVEFGPPEATLKICLFKNGDLIKKSTIATAVDGVSTDSSPIISYSLNGILVIFYDSRSIPPNGGLKYRLGSITPGTNEFVFNSVGLVPLTTEDSRNASLSSCKYVDYGPHYYLVYQDDIELDDNICYYEINKSGNN